MNSSAIEQLYRRCLDGTATQTEREELTAWLLLPENETAARALLLQAYRDPKITVDVATDTSASILSAIVGAGAPVRRISWIQRHRRWAAAILLLLATGTFYLLLSPPKKQNTPVTEITPTPSDIAPGGNKAILTLGDGSSVLLDSVENGLVRSENGTTINKVRNGELTYQSISSSTASIVYNTLTTPRGGQYQLTLPDGTRVWLNAASSISYPTSFVGDKRAIRMTGEAYFEVARNKAKPFLVDVNGRSTVEVLGTHFNVNSYGDIGSIKTTLLEGAVKVKGQKNIVTLKPGQQAISSSSGNQPASVTSDINLDQIMAWKNGFFNLQNASLPEVMKQLERWYDIQVKYEGEIADLNFQGKINRAVKLSTVLNWLGELGINSRLQGRTLLLSAKK